MRENGFSSVRIEHLQDRIRRRRATFAIVVLIAATATLITALIWSLGAHTSITKATDVPLSIGTYAFYAKTVVQFALSIWVAYLLFQNRTVRVPATLLLLSMVVTYQVSGVEFPSLSVTLGLYVRFREIAIGVNVVGLIPFLIYRSYRQSIKDYLVERQNEVIRRG